MGMSYTQVSAGLHHILLLRSDAGRNLIHPSVCTVLLQSDSPAVACGCNIDGQGDTSGRRNVLHPGLCGSGVP